MADVTLAEFVLARVAEDEAAAEDAGTGDPWESYVQDCDVHIGAAPDGPHIALVGRQSWPGVPEEAAHIARWDPARVLAECEAKRRIVELHHPVDPCDEHDASFRTIPCETLRLLALPYASHPEYRAEWAS